MLFRKQLARARKLLFQQDTKTILGNFFSLVLIQGTNFILPLVVLPYLVSVIGIDKCGLVFMAQAFISYWIILTDYGFNLSSTRGIVVHRNDQDKISEIVTRTLVTKLFLCVAAFIVFTVIVQMVPVFSRHSSLYYLSFIMVLGQSLVPLWFFQGIEKMKFLTLLNLLSKIVFTLLIFIWVKSPDDYIYVAIFYGLGSMAAGLSGIWLMFTKFNVKVKLPKNYRLLDELKGGWYVFLSNFSINVYISSNIFILGLYASETIVGYYSIADKVIYAVRQVLNVFFQSTYPQACKQVIQGHQFLKTFFKRYFLPFTAAVIILCLVLFVLADFITAFLTKKNIPEISNAIRILSIVPVIVCLNIPAFQTLLAYNYQKSYTVILAAGSLLNIILNAILAKFYLIPGTITSVIITEIFITCGLYIILNRRHKKEALF